AAAQFSTGLDPDYKAFDQRHTAKFETAISGEHKLGMAIGPSRLFGFALGGFIVALLYRRVATLGRMSIIFLVGILAVLAWVLFEGAIRFDPAFAFDTTLNDDEKPKHFGLALGTGMVLAIYSYLGYYNVCYLG